MHIQRRTKVIVLAITGLLIVTGLAAELWQSAIRGFMTCLAHNELSNTNLTNTDFAGVHSAVDTDGNTYLIFGGFPPSPLSASPELAAFVGRWEGYDYSPPVKRDYKVVLSVRDISAQGGTADLWLGTNLQYPAAVRQIHFQVIPGAAPAIEFCAPFGGVLQTVRLVYDPAKKSLTSPDGNYRSFVLDQSRAFTVYKDYSRYLAGKRIYPKAYRDGTLQQYGDGYLLYLPEGYEDSPSKTWPLIVFLHGSGDKGDNVLLLAKASPFMYPREKGPLPFIIVAPLLNTSNNLFPTAYLDGVLAEAQSLYHVDKTRIYVTGLSLGGEASYRWAILHPETFAAIAPLSALLDDDQIAQLDRIVDLPIWAIHGADDTIIPLAVGRKPVDALIQLGGHIQFSILQAHDHDTWTDTYSDPAFYQWLLSHPGK